VGSSGTSGAPLPIPTMWAPEGLWRIYFLQSIRNFTMEP
jgi:phenylacetate-coenzyme A ligase PaaK-like adenylate-forming protein